VPDVPLSDGHAPPYAAADFTEAMLALLPSGPVWPREPGAVLPQVIAGLAPTYERMSARAAALLLDAPVGTLDELLTEWEATLGLPDPCAGGSPTVSQRRASAAAAIAARGGQSARYFLGVLTALGRTGTVQSFAPARAGLLAVGSPLYGPDWAFVWEATVDPAEVATAATDAVVECVLRRIAPAHTILILTFVDVSGIGAPDPVLGDLGIGIFDRIGLHPASLAALRSQTRPWL